MNENENIVDGVHNSEPVSKEEQYAQVLELFDKLSDLQGKPNYRIAADMAYIEANFEPEEPLYPETLYILASKLEEASGSFFCSGLLHEEYLDALRYALEYGITENHSPDLIPMRPEDTLIFLQNANVSVFGALVEQLALDNQDYYAIGLDYRNISMENTSTINKAISDFKHPSVLVELVKEAFNDKKNKDFYSSGPYSIGFEDQSGIVLFELRYNDVPIVKGNIADLKLELCASEDVYAYNELVSAIYLALPAFRFTGENAEKYAGNPETNMKFARYFCGDFDGVITQETYNAMEASGALYEHDTVDYEPIFDGVLYPTQADSSAAQIEKYGYHYLDDRRQKPSLNAQIQSAEAKADAGANRHTRGVDLVL